MNNPVLFSIVIPTYNRAHLIPATIESILAQTYQHFEIIIVDDGSTDNTQEIVKKYLSERVRYYSKTNGERAAARNYGTQKATGQYINWFDSDDIMFPDHLEDAAALISRYQDPEIFAQGHQSQSSAGQLIRTYPYATDINAEMYKGNPMANSPVIVRRDIALANPFNEDRELSGSEDYELWLRMAARYRIYSSPKITVAIVLHDGRSVVTMNNPDQMTSRFEKFIYYTLSNQEVLTLLGPNKNAFIMKNYLLIAVDLTSSNHLKQGAHYLKKAFWASPKILFERGFYAFLKHYIRHSVSRA